MIILSHIIVALPLVAATLCVILIFRRSRRKAFWKAKADQLSEANRPFEVWICRYCGFMSLMRNQDCTWCSAPRPENFVSRMIPSKDFTAQLEKPLPKPYTESPMKSV